MFKRLAIFFCTAFLALTAVGVNALWVYWEPPTPIDDGGLLGLTGFYYKTEEVLPDDTSQQSNAVGFIEYVINNTKAGLNSKKGPALFAQIKEKDDKQLHSKDHTTSTNLDHVFSDIKIPSMEERAVKVMIKRTRSRSDVIRLMISPVRFLSKNSLS